GLRRDPEFRAPNCRAIHTGTLYPITDYVPCRLFGEKLARITSQCGDGFLCFRDRSRRDGWPLIGWLDPPALALALRLRKRIRIVDRGDNRRLHLASRKTGGAQSRIAAGQLIPAARAAEPMARAYRRIHRVFRFLIDVQLSSLLSLRTTVCRAYRGHHAHVFGIPNRNRHGSRVRETEQSHGKRRDDSVGFCAASRSRGYHAHPVSRCDRG